MIANTFYTKYKKMWWTAKEITKESIQLFDSNIKCLPKKFSCRTIQVPIINQNKIQSVSCLSIRWHHLSDTAEAVLFVMPSMYGYRSPLHACNAIVFVQRRGIQHQYHSVFKKAQFLTHTAKWSTWNHTNTCKCYLILTKYKK